MAALAEFAPLRSESIDTIRARVDAGVNAGLDPADPSWRDTTPAGFFWDHTQTMALEAELLWDMASVELPASVFLPFSWGIYLDYWGALLSVPRKDAAAASGEATFTNTTGASLLIGTGSQVAAPANDPEQEPLIYATTADATVAAGDSVTLPILATATGSEYNVAVDAVTLPLGALAGVTVTNADQITGGADVESDPPYKTRLLLEFSASRGGGTKDDYVAAALARPGIGAVVVEPRWAGNGTVRLILTDQDNNPLSVGKIAEEQEYWDPTGVPGDGEGAAPINHVVTIATPAAVTVDTILDLDLDAGFTVTGEVGKEDVAAKVTAVVSAYIDSLKAGDDVQLHRVLAAAIGVTGVHEVSSVTLEGVAADFAISALQVAQPGTVTFA